MHTRRPTKNRATRTSTEHAPWFIIPANHKWFRNLAVSQIVADTMEAMKMKFPKPTVDIEEIRRKYHQAEKEEETGTAERQANEG